MKVLEGKVGSVIDNDLMLPSVLSSNQIILLKVSYLDTQTNIYLMHISGAGAKDIANKTQVSCRTT